MTKQLALFPLGEWARRVWDADGIEVYDLADGEMVPVRYERLPAVPLALEVRSALLCTEESIG